jgi:hypothetical protein
MSTHDVPGANPANCDVLKAGCWAEHTDGSLIYVKGTENGQVVYEIYDVAQDHPVYYQDAMREQAFKTQFSFAPVGQSSVAWTWHDKTPFPWSRVMKTFDKPVAQAASAGDMLSAAARVAESLKLRAKALTQGDVEAKTEHVRRKGRPIVERIERALEALFE